MKGEWGYSFAYNSPVRGLILLRARNTLLLTGCATLIAWLIAVPLGVWTASRAGSWPDRVCILGTSFFIAVPEMVVVFGLLYFAIRTHALPVGGMLSREFEQFGLAEKMIDLAKHSIIPVFTLVVASLPILVRHVRASMIEVLNAPFIVAARGHGITRSRILFGYALPAGANPMISLFGLSLAGLLSGSLLVEVITGWPGLGPLLLEASVSKDLYVVIGVVMSSTVFMIMGNLLADALLVAVDPRVQTE
jgi:peptide/nickel transport system permease protein